MKKNCPVWCTTHLWLKKLYFLLKNLTVFNSDVLMPYCTTPDRGWWLIYTSHGELKFTKHKYFYIFFGHDSVCVLSVSSITVSAHFSRLRNFFKSKNFGLLVYELYSNINIVPCKLQYEFCIFHRCCTMCLHIFEHRKVTFLFIYTHNK